MIKIITSDLLSATEKYIVHQCNCTSHYAAGIAAAIFNKFPYSDIYITRMKPDIPGEIIIKGNGEDQRYIVALLAQYQPGGINTNSSLDNEKARKKYFHRALINLSKVPNLESIAFNYRIGCGIAGGDWEWYLGTITNFATYVEKQQGAQVVIYQRIEDQ